MKHFCMAPFVHIQKNSFGEYNPCCMFNDRIYSEYDSIHQAFNGDENKLLRKKMLKDEYISGCDKCYRDESLGKKSYRQRFNERYDESYIKHPIIKELEIALSNKCNFKCVDCNTKFSSSWYDDDILLGRDFYIKKGRNIRNKVIDNDFDEMDLNEIKILGGEPFLDNRYIEIFKKLDTSKITLFFVTNNSIFPNEKWIEQFSNFKFINFNISIDGVHDVAEFVRFGTKFSKFEKNYKKWLAISPDNMQIIPHFVFHSLNILNFDDTVDWLSTVYEKKIEDILHLLSYDFLSQPEMLNASFLPDDCKHMIINRSKYLRKEIQDFFQINKKNNTHLKDLIRYSKFLNLRNDIPIQSKEVLSCLT